MVAQVQLIHPWVSPTPNGHIAYISTDPPSWPLAAGLALGASSDTINSSSFLFDGQWCLLSDRPWTGSWGLREKDRTPA